MLPLWIHVFCLGLTLSVVFLMFAEL